MIARNRWAVLGAVRIVGAAGAVFGLVLIGRAGTMGPKLIGAALVVSAILMSASVTGALARRWRSSPDEPGA